MQDVPEDIHVRGHGLGGEEIVRGERDACAEIGIRGDGETSGGHGRDARVLDDEFCGGADGSERAAGVAGGAADLDSLGS